MKMVKNQYKFNVLAKEFKIFLDRVIAKDLKLYENLHAQINDIEERKQQYEIAIHS